MRKATQDMNREFTKEREMINKYLTNFRAKYFN